MFTLANFVSDCCSAVEADPTYASVHEVMLRAFSDPKSVLAAVGEPVAGGLVPIYRSTNVTIVNVIWKPSMTIMPHNHEMWGIIGIYGGREDNIFWRRIKGDPDGRIEATGAQALSTGDVTPLGKDIIHSVTNPIPRLTGAIHVYGGDFFAADRSEWNPENLHEQPYDIEKVKALYKD